MTFAAERQAREERQNIFEGIKPLVEKLNAGTRLTVEERTQLAERQGEIAGLNEEIRTYEEARRLSAESAPITPEVTGPDAVEARERDFSNWLKRGEVTPELRAAGEATPSAGGYLVPPGWWQRLQVALKVYGGIANDFEQISTESGQPMQWAAVDPTTVKGQLVGKQTAPPANQASAGGSDNENVQIQDVDYIFGNGTLGAYMFTSGIQKTSFQLANDSAFDLDQFVSNRVGEALGRAYAEYAVSGSGSNEPLGIITALNAASGLTSGGVLTLGAATSVHTLNGDVTELVGNVLGFGSIVKMIHAIDPAYRRLGANWYMNDTVALNEMTVTDNYGHPIWQPDPQVGQPDRLYGFPVTVDNDLPDITASTSSGVVFGHLRSAMVKRTVTQSGLLRFNERFADFMQIGFMGYSRMDTRSNDLRAAVVSKAAAS